MWHGFYCHNQPQSEVYGIGFARLFRDVFACFCLLHGNFALGNGKINRLYPLMYGLPYGYGSIPMNAIWMPSLVRRPICHPNVDVNRRATGFWQIPIFGWLLYIKLWLLMISCHFFHIYIHTIYVYIYHIYIYHIYIYIYTIYIYTIYIPYIYHIYIYTIYIFSVYTYIYIYIL